MQTYNENEQLEKIKFQNVQIDDKRVNRKWNGDKSYVQVEEHIKENANVK